MGEQLEYEIDPTTSIKSLYLLLRDVILPLKNFKVHPPLKLQLMYCFYSNLLCSMHMFVTCRKSYRHSQILGHN